MSSYIIRQINMHTTLPSKQVSTRHVDKVVALLLEHGADMILAEDNQWTPLHAACQRLFFSGARIRLGMIFNYLILWFRVKGQG